MAKLGVRTFDELVGHSDWLDMQAGIEHWKAKGLDFSKVFYSPKMPASVARRHCETWDHGLDQALDHQLIAGAKGKPRSKAARVSRCQPRSATATARRVRCCQRRRREVWSQRAAG